jgi:hypothetical protein
VAIEADFKVDKTQNRVGPVESGSQILCSTPQIAAEVARLAIGRIQPGQVPRPAFVGKKGLVADTAKSRVTWEKYAGDGTEFAELFAVLPIGDGRDTGLTFADAALVTSGSRGCVPAADANAVPSTTHLKCMPRSAEAGQYTAQEAIYKSPGTLEAGVLAKDRGCVFVEGLLDPIVKDSHLKLGPNFIHTYEKVNGAGHRDHWGRGTRSVGALLRCLVKPGGGWLKITLAAGHNTKHWLFHIALAHRIDCVEVQAHRLPEHVQHLLHKVNVLEACSPPATAPSINVWRRQAAAAVAATQAAARSTTAEHTRYIVADVHSISMACRTHPHWAPSPSAVQWPSAWQLR